MLAQRLLARQGAIRSLMPRPITIDFPEWLPDQPALANPGLLLAQGVTPRVQSYGPFPSLAAQSGALTAYARGAVAAKDSSGNTYLYAGDATKLYQVRDQTVTDKSGATYTLTARDRLEAAVFGSNVIFTNNADPVQSITVGAAGAFADHITSTLKPEARHIATIRNFLWLGHTNDTTDGMRPRRVWWSAINDSADFDPDASTQCDFQDLADGGAVTRLVGGADYGVIFQENQISRATYTGDNLIFQIDPIDRRRGTPISGSVVGHGRLAFYISEEGFFVFDGTQSIPLGANRFDRWFWDQFDIANAHRVSAAIDFPNKLVCWLFPGENAAGGNPNRMLLYNWEAKRQAYIDIDAELVLATATQAFSLDDLNNIGTDIDDEEVFDVSWDDPQWKGGLFRFAAFDTLHRLSYFTGANVAAQIDTREMQLAQGGNAFVSNTRPLVDGGAPTIAVGSRDLQTESVSFGSDVAMNADGECPQEVEARYHRLRFKMPAGETWEHAQGVVVQAIETGAY